jgi:long-chain acyl-CoA synthetase
MDSNAHPDSSAPAAVTDGSARRAWLAPGDAPAVYWQDEIISHSDLLFHARRAAETFAAAPGDRVILFSENRPEWIAALYALFSKRAVAVPLDAFSPASDVAEAVSMVRPVAIFVSGKTRAVAEEAIAGLPDPPRILLLSDLPAGSPEPGEILSPIEAADGDLAAILFTSGTTGRPKGVKLTFGNMRANVESVSVTVPIYRRETRVFALLPLHHILPLMGTVMAPLAVGGSLVLAHTLEPAAMLALMRKRKPTILIGVPRLYALFRKGVVDTLLRHAPTRALWAFAKKHPGLARPLLRPVRAKFGGKLAQLVCGGAPLDYEVARDMTVMGFEMLEGYGMTEAAPMIAFPRPGSLRLGSVGNPFMPGSVKIQDGEILARGPQVFPGYWENEEETREALDADGWLHTGDLGYLDRDGYLFITGRKKELLVLPNGKKVNPNELEEKMAALGGADLVEAAVTMKDGLLHALLHPRAGLEGDIPGAQAEYFRRTLLDTLNRGTTPAKKITRLTVVSEDLPRTRIGKLRRHELAALATGTQPRRAEAALSPEEQSFYEVLEEFLSGSLECSRVTPGSRWDLDLALDSLSRLSLLAWFDKTFGVKWPENIFAKHRTVAELLRETVKNRRFFKKKAAEAPAAGLAGSAAEEGEELPRSTWIHPFLGAVLSGLARMCFRLEVEGLENIPEGGVVFAANHQSYLDGLFVARPLDRKRLRKTYFYAKAKHVRGIAAALAKRCNVIVLTEGVDVARSIRQLAKALSGGGSAIIFPEGTRTADGRVGEFRPMFTRIAQETGVPVVPVAIEGAFEALPRGHHFPRFGSVVTVRFLPPVAVAADADPDEASERVREAVIGRA